MEAEKGVMIWLPIVKEELGTGHSSPYRPSANISFIFIFQPPPSGSKSPSQFPPGLPQGKLPIKFS